MGLEFQIWLVLPLDRGRGSWQVRLATVKQTVIILVFYAFASRVGRRGGYLLILLLCKIRSCSLRIDIRRNSLDRFHQSSGLPVFSPLLCGVMGVRVRPNELVYDYLWKDLWIFWYLMIVLVRFRHKWIDTCRWRSYVSPIHKEFLPTSK